MNAPEIKHYASQLASLTVSAARATSTEQLSDVHALLEETFAEALALALLAHDGERTARQAAEEAATAMTRDLLSRIEPLSRMEVRA